MRIIESWNASIINFSANNKTATACYVAAIHLKLILMQDIRGTKVLAAKPGDLSSNTAYLYLLALEVQALSFFMSSQTNCLSPGEADFVSRSSSLESFPWIRKYGPHSAQTADLLGQIIHYFVRSENVFPTLRARTREGHLQTYKDQVSLLFQWILGPYGFKAEEFFDEAFWDRIALINVG